MTGVPFFHLALLPQIEILKHVKSEELLLLSLISEKCKSLVKSVKRSIEDVTIECISEEMMMISVGDDVSIMLRKPEDLTTIQGVDKMPICSIKKDSFLLSLVFYGAGSYHEMVHRLVQHLFSVFKKVDKLTVYLTNVENVNSNAIWNFTNSLNVLVVRIQNRNLIDEELSFIFEEVTVSGVLSIPTLTEEVEYHRGFTNEQVLLEVPQWNNMDAIIASESSAITIRCPLPSASELNRLLKAWIAGERMRNLKKFTIGNGEDVSPRFMDKVLQGITVDVMTGFQSIFRRVDGTRALLDLDDKSFRFYIEV